MYAGASGDYYQIHYDQDYAKSNDLPGIIIHGALKNALLGKLITDWIGENGDLLELSVQYRGMDVPDDELMDFTLNMAKKIAQNSPYATALSKWMIYKQASPNADEHVELYRIAESITSLTEDSKEGGTAFRERRDPDFKGM